MVSEARASQRDVGVLRSVLPAMHVPLIGGAGIGAS